MGGGLVGDDAYAGQMALKAHLLARRRDDVFAQTPDAEAVGQEVLETALAHLPLGFVREKGAVIRPDGVRVSLEEDFPLIIAARLVQEDFCVLQKADGAGEHVLTSAALCFPASWTLSEKLGRPLTAIHGPVDSYTTDMATRVQRMFHAIRPDRPLWRQNALLYADPALYQPRAEADPRDEAHLDTPYLRSERQCLLCLPRTGAVVFSIHTYVVPLECLTSEQAEALRAFPIDPAHAAG